MPRVREHAERDRQARQATRPINDQIGKLRSRYTLVLNAYQHRQRLRPGSVETPRAEIAEIYHQLRQVTLQLEQRALTLPAGLQEHEFLRYTRLAIATLERDLIAAGGPEIVGSLPAPDTFAPLASAPPAADHPLDE